MNIKKMAEQENPLLERKDVTLTIDHDPTGTPRLYEVRKAVSSMYKVDEDTVYVIKLKPTTGVNKSIAEVEIYKNPKKAKLLVDKYIQLRNQSERRKKES
jgi:ribosomal protein S24E